MLSKFIFRFIPPFLYLCGCSCSRAQEVNSNLVDAQWNLTESEWRDKLTDLECYVLKKKVQAHLQGLWNNKEKGIWEKACQLNCLLLTQNINLVQDGQALGALIAKM